MKKTILNLFAIGLLYAGASAATFIQATNVTLSNATGSVNPGPYLQNGTPVGAFLIDGSGLIDPTSVQTGDLVTGTVTDHIAGYNPTRVSRVRDTGETTPLGTATLTFDLGGNFNFGGIALWNNSETNQTARGWENTLVYTSGDGINFTSTGVTFTWAQSTITAGNQGTTEPVGGWILDGGPQIQYLSSAISGVTHVRLDIDTFTGGDAIVQAMEVRFIEGIAVPEPSSLALLGLGALGLLLRRRR